MEKIKGFSHPKTSEKVLELVTTEDLRGRQILDVGAGEGYFVQMLGEYLKSEYGIAPAEVIRACDLCPERFKYQDVPCEKADANQRLPYEDNSFDAVCCIEVIEHVENHFHLARELLRITKPDGRVILTTPNVLSINSRIRSLHSGFPELFNPLPLGADGPSAGHIHPISLYYLHYVFRSCGVRSVKVHVDRMKKSGLAWALLLYLPIALGHLIFRGRRKGKNPDIYEQNRVVVGQMNSLRVLTARTIILEATK